MTRLFRGALFALLAILLCACSSYASTRRVATTDHMPLGDWTYDAMISLAADGLVPGYAARVFQGDRLFDRMQMAEVVATVIDAAESKTLRPSQVELMNHLMQEFKPELNQVAVGIDDKWAHIAERNRMKNGDTFLLGFVRGLEEDSTKSDGRLVMPYRISLFSNISDRVFGMGTIADKEEKFFHQLRNSPVLDKVILQGYSNNLVWSLGRQYQSWGPGYSGSLILSDNSIGFWQGRVAADVDFGKLFGRFKITEFASVFHDETTLYFFGRRYEKQLSPRWNWGISETALMNKSPNPTILVLPFYLYQQVFGGPGSSTDQSMNTLYATDLTYRTKGGTEYYGEFLVDDMTTPKITYGLHYERPRKTGYTLGVYLPKFLPSKKLSTLRAEYISVDQLTYSATRDDVPELAYVHNGDIIGHPIGPNAKAVYIRGEHYLSDKWSLIGEYFNQRQKAFGVPQVAVEQEFLKQRQKDAERVVSLMAAYDISPDTSVAVRIAPFKTASQSGTKYELRASYAF